MTHGDALRLRPPTQSPPAGGGGGDGNGGHLDLLRAEGERLIAAADDAIDRVLSGDSAEFLRASRQHGGQ